MSVPIFLSILPPWIHGYVNVRFANLFQEHWSLETAPRCSWARGPLRSLRSSTGSFSSSSRGTGGCSGFTCSAVLLSSSSSSFLRALTCSRWLCHLRCRSISIAVKFMPVVNSGEFPFVSWDVELWTEVNSLLSFLLIKEKAFYVPSVRCLRMLCGNRLRCGFMKQRMFTQSFGTTNKYCNLWWVVSFELHFEFIHI